jgi:hypothetical protein
VCDGQGGVLDCVVHDASLGEPPSLEIWPLILTLLLIVWAEKLHVCSETVQR